MVDVVRIVKLEDGLVVAAVEEVVVENVVVIVKCQRPINIRFIMKVYESANETVTTKDFAK